MLKHPHRHQSTTLLPDWHGRLPFLPAVLHPSNHGSEAMSGVQCRAVACQLVVAAAAFLLGTPRTLELVYDGDVLCGRSALQGAARRCSCCLLVLRAVCVFCRGVCLPGWL